MYAGGAVQRSVPQFPGTRTLQAHDMHTRRVGMSSARHGQEDFRNVMKDTKHHETHSSGPGRSTFGCDRHLQHEARFQTRSGTRLADRRTAPSDALSFVYTYIYLSNFASYLGYSLSAEEKSSPASL